MEYIITDLYSNNGFGEPDLKQIQTDSQEIFKNIPGDNR